MLNNFEKIKVDIFGESHSDFIGVEIEGLPLGETIDTCYVQSFLDRRKSSLNSWSTPRLEDDKIEFVSGIENNKIVGKVKAIIKNNSVKKQDYEKLKYLPRPSHADYVYSVVSGLNECPQGGGAFSGRMTAPFCIIGGIAKYYLEKSGIKIYSYIRSVGKVEGDNFSESVVSIGRLENIKTEIKTLSNADKMLQEIKSALQDGDSVGGVVDCIVYGLPVGIGGALFDGLEGRIAKSIYAIPGVKGVSFGEGFNISKMRGSEANDSFYYDNNIVKTKTNHSGGINGGISNGMPINISVAFRPTPSIAKIQETINLQTKTNTTIQVGGRHDSCIAIRGAVVVEAAVSTAILDAVL